VQGSPQLQLEQAASCMEAFRCGRCNMVHHILKELQQLPVGE
jgi:hypothetical protein